MLSEIYSTIKDFAFLPNRALDSFRRLTNNTGSTYSVMQTIETEFISAASEEHTARVIFKQGDSNIADIKQADRVYIITNIKSIPDGSAVVLFFAPNQIPDRQPWELQKAITENELNNAFYTELGNRPREMLLNFSFWPNFLNDMKVLKNQLALPENWSYKENPDDDDFPILKNYIYYTFAKLWQDKQVYLSVDGRYSVFNTGLVNRNYQYIYVLFEKNIGTKPWKFNMFCIPGIRQGGRTLAESFRILPKPAHYFNDISDISYIIALDKSPDEQLPDLQPDHYFIDHPERLPNHFLLDGCRKSSEISSILKKDISSCTTHEIEVYWHTVGEMIGNNPDVYDDLESSFRNAVRKAVMRVSWNYRTAIPVYFPANNKMSILLPLSFSTDSDAEVALVVERNAVSQKYTAPTILKLPTAYANARLVCKPESDWLNQRVFEPSVDNVAIEDGEE